MNRREFIGWVGVGGLASSLPIAIAACTPQKTSQTPAPQTDAQETQTGDFQIVGTVADLEANGQLLNEQTASPVLVIRNPENADEVVALNPTCTHAGCTVAWQAEQKALICPCHNSIFASDGRVLKGPATEPLASYPVKTEGDSILVQVS